MGLCTYLWSCLPATTIRTSCKLSHLYVLGERILDTDIRNAVLREMIRVMDLELSPESSAIKSGRSPPLQVVTVIYQGTTSASPARRLLVDWCLAFGHRCQYTMLREKEFLLDLATAFSEKADLGMPSSGFRGVPLRHGEYVVRGH